MTHSTMILNLIAAAIIALATCASGAVVTLYHVEYPVESPATRTTDISVEIGATTMYSLIGPAQETGVTKYAVEEILSRFVFHGNADNPTVTAISEPVMRNYVMEQGASVYRASYPGIVTEAGDGRRFWVQGLKQDCKLSPEKTQGVCVDVVELPFPTAIATQDSKTIYSTFTSTFPVTTYTGSLYPIATLTTSAASGVVASMMAVISGVVAISAFLAVRL